MAPGTRTRLAAVRFQAHARIDRGGEALLDDVAQEVDVVDREEVGLVLLEVLAQLRTQIGQPGERGPGGFVPLEAKAEVPEAAVERVPVELHESSLRRYLAGGKLRTISAGLPTNRGVSCDRILPARILATAELAA